MSKHQNRPPKMKHPFYKLFWRAMRKSTPDDNFVLKEAEKIRARGYNVEEIYTVLKHVGLNLLNDDDNAIMSEAIEEFSKYVEEE